MAKRKGTPGLRKALAAVDRLSGQMGKEVQADFAVALGASNAGVRNLRKQLGRLERDAMSTVLASSSSALAAAKGARGAAIRTRVQQEAAGDRYGGSYGGAASAAFGPAGATAKAGARTAAARAVQGREAVQTTATIMAIAREGAGAQKAAAEYALSRAAAMRNQADANTIAQITGQLYQTALQAELARDEWLFQQKKMRQWAKQDAKDAQKFDWEAMQQLTDLAPAAVNDIGLILRNKQSELYDPEADAATTAAKVAAEYGITNPDDPRLQILIAAAVNLKKFDQEPGMALFNATEMFYGGKPGWGKHSTGLLELYQAGVRSSYATYVQGQNPTDPDEQPGPGQPIKPSTGWTSPVGGVGFTSQYG